MNKDNVRKAIALMKRASKVSMSDWQDGPSPIAIVERELHSCGNSACFAGWGAVSPEFKADGGSVTPYGGPIFREKTGALAIAEWLEIPWFLAKCLVLGEDDFYDPIPFEDVKAEHIIEKLELLLQN